MQGTGRPQPAGRSRPGTEKRPRDGASEPLLPGSPILTVPEELAAVEPVAVTGNFWVSLPDLDPATAAARSVGVLSGVARALIEFTGAPVGRQPGHGDGHGPAEGPGTGEAPGPLLMPVVEQDGRRLWPPAPEGGRTATAGPATTASGAPAAVGACDRPATTAARATAAGAGDGPVTPGPRVPAAATAGDRPAGRLPGSESPETIGGAPQQLPSPASPELHYLEGWVPQWQIDLPGLPDWRLEVTWLAPAGQRGFAVALRLFPAAGSGERPPLPAGVRLGLLVRPGTVYRTVYHRRPLAGDGGPFPYRWTKALAWEAPGTVPVAALALRSAAGDPPERETGGDGWAFWSPPGTGELIVYGGVAPEADGAATTAVHLARVGWQRLLDATLQWLAARDPFRPQRDRNRPQAAGEQDPVEPHGDRQRVAPAPEPALSPWRRAALRRAGLDRAVALGLLSPPEARALEDRLRCNLWFSLFYAHGRTLDGDDWVLLTSRSPRYYVSGAHWTRDSLLWAFPALLSTDPDLAREILVAAFARYTRYPGEHSQYLDGTVLYPGWELDQAAAWPLTLARYLEATSDASILDEPAVAAGLAAVLAAAEARRDEATGLVATFLLPSDDPAQAPFVTYDNALYAQALEDLARASARTQARRDRPAAPGHGDASAVAVLPVAVGPEVPWRPTLAAGSAGRASAADHTPGAGAAPNIPPASTAGSAFSALASSRPGVAPPAGTGPAGTRTTRHPGGSPDPAWLAGRAAQTRRAVLAHCVVPGPWGPQLAWAVAGPGGAGAVLYDEPPGTLELLGPYGFARRRPDDPLDVAAVLANTVRWIYSAHNPYGPPAGPFATPTCPHARHPWLLSVAAGLLAGRREYLGWLARAPMDSGFACETVDAATGQVRTGPAFATCAGFVTWAALATLERLALEEPDGRSAREAPGMGTGSGDSAH
ncbi:hypothetical protein [Thermaerobacter subterraneus]|uniref:Metal-independent alpha-mannosidase n=1 Tax=Thermaerobacter subterraneus DSM 13965 TaxID=867903 RepID=K6Q1I4_9FIRM|nr:hypothetical protein [Thermaerobacter subterraneus]EKP94988.1 hypothetical protein ThesuDRAFT_00711 [Thermaerobacter subterraneus DSM 13965]